MNWTSTQAAELASPHDPTTAVDRLRKLAARAAWHPDRLELDGDEAAAIFAEMDADTEMRRKTKRRIKRAEAREADAVRREERAQTAERNAAIAIRKLKRARDAALLGTTDPATAAAWAAVAAAIRALPQSA